MSKPKTKKWNFISSITEEWVKNSYPNASKTDAWKYKDRMNTFFEFMKTTDNEFVEAYKRSKDRIEWAKRMGFKVVTFYNHRLGKGYATNTVRAEVSTVRAFCRDNCTTLTVPRRKIAKAKRAKGEHEFTREELAKMFYVADVRDKAILSCAVSLGFSMQDFSELPQKHIESLVNKAIEAKTDFVGFNHERKKTGVESRSHLTPEAVNSLKAWFNYVDKKRASEGKPKSKWVWCNSNDNHLSGQALNDVIKNLVTKADIITTGKIRFHLIRKFLMNALHDAGFTSWEIKRIVGKEIPTTDNTYLQGLNRTVDKKFSQVYSYIQLTRHATKNHLHIEELEQKIQQLEITNEGLTQRYVALEQLVQYAIPKEALVKAIMKTAEKLPDMTNEKLESIKRNLTFAKETPEIMEIWKRTTLQLI